MALAVAFCRALWYNICMLPQDPVMLLSFVNLKLRDEYDSLDELCADLDVDRAQLEARLASVGFYYDAQHNCFR